MFRSESNHLFFVGTTGDDILPVVAALYHLIQKQGYRDIILDFSKVTFLDPRFMLPLVTMTRAYRMDKVDFELVMPADVKTTKLLQNTNWAHLMLPEKFESREALSRNHLPAIQYLDASQHNAAVDRSVQVILQSVEGLDRSRLKALEWSLSEVTDNVLNHSSSPVGGIVQVTTFAKRQLVDFYVCDAGIGIPKSLRQGHPEIDNDVKAVRAAIEEGVTRDSTTNQGNGLFGTFKCCEVSGGSFDVLSGNVALRHTPGSLHVSRNTIPFNGTFVRASINYGFEQLLERALIFKGRPHDPGFDYMERFYQQNSDEVEFMVCRELDAFGSREAGKFARIKLENLMDRGRNVICLDFKNVHLISSSFADEVFGKLFVKLGPIGFGQICKFKNVDATVQKLIDRSIAQRMKQ
jgi:anti-anti-sigma regulatory factor/anti-sigma regulatory factor (Ser/Thr protein kinase)